MNEPLYRPLHTNDHVTGDEITAKRMRFLSRFAEGENLCTTTTECEKAILDLEIKNCMFSLSFQS